MSDTLPARATTPAPASVPAPAPASVPAPAPASGLVPARPPATDRVELRGIRATGTHGLLPEERERAQPFTVDLDVTVDLRAAGQSDDLADTIDYGAVVAVVVAEVAGPSAALLERLAERIAAQVLAVAGDRATSVTVAVHKLRPPVPHDLISAGVRITRP